MNARDVIRGQFSHPSIRPDRCEWQFGYSLESCPNDATTEHDGLKVCAECLAEIDEATEEAK